MSETGSAVFLSYASQDAGAAGRIAAALHDAGVDAWFDRSELRGGDAWDAKIRRQIKDCALFVPMISAHTQARREGYFRFEWHLAEQRTLLMAHDAPFLLPIVIDDTPSDEARVPDKFRERQWMSVTDAASASAFAAQVRVVLSDDRAITPTVQPMAAQRARSPRSSRSHRWRNLAFATLVGMGAVYAIQLLVEPPSIPASSVERPESTDERPYYAGSVAVLPFRVPAGDPDRAAAVASLHDELLVQLGQMKPLDLISRTSSRLDGEPGRSIRAIGREVGADFVVEGSLRGAGSRLLVTLRMVEAATDRMIFSQTFGSEAGDVGSSTVSAKLRAWDMAIAIYRSVKAERPPTAEARQRLQHVVSELEQESEEREMRYWGNDGQPRDFSQFSRLVEIARAIIGLDPDNLAAHRDLGLFLSQNPAGGLDELLLVLRRGLRLDPLDFEILRHVGTYYLLYRGRPDLAVPYLQKALPLFEADGSVAHNWPYYHLSAALNATGQPVAALRVLERAPLAPEIAHLTYWSNAYEAARQFKDGLAFLLRQLERIRREEPKAPVFLIEAQIAGMEARWAGDPRPILEFVERLDGEPRATPGFKASQLFSAADYSRTLDYFPRIDLGSDPLAPQGLSMTVMRGLSLLHSGNPQLARSYLRGLLAPEDRSSELAKFYDSQPGSAQAVAAIANAVLENPTRAHEAMNRAVSLVDPTRNLYEYYFVHSMVGVAHVQLGETKEACETIDMLLSGPTGLSVGAIMIDGFFGSLRPAPEYEAVIRRHKDQLKDPAILDTYFAPPR